MGISWQVIGGDLGEELVYFGEGAMKNSQKHKGKTKEMVKQSSVSEAEIDIDDDEVIIYEYADDEEFVRRCKEKARNLWKKYIAVGSEYEVNISYQLRRRYESLLRNEEEWQANEEYADLVKLRDLFDSCCNVMKRLIKHSWQRFTESEHFEKIKKEFGIKQSDQKYMKR